MSEPGSEEEIEEIRSALWPGDDFRLTWGAEFLEGLAKALPEHAGLSGMLGGLYTDLGRYEEALAADERTVALDPSSAEAWYNLGCSQSLLGRAGDAYRSISRAIELGFDDGEAMEKDEDLEFLRRGPLYGKLLRAMAAKGRKED